MPTPSSRESITSYLSIESNFVFVRGPRSAGSAAADTGGVQRGEQQRDGGVAAAPGLRRRTARTRHRGLPPGAGRRLWRRVSGEFISIQVCASMF